MGCIGGGQQLAEAVLREYRGIAADHVSRAPRHFHSRADGECCIAIQNLEIVLCGYWPMEIVGASLRIIAELLFTLTARYFLLMFGVSWPEWAESILGMFL
jgi:hypothetical protein